MMLLGLRARPALASNLKNLGKPAKTAEEFPDTIKQEFGNEEFGSKSVISSPIKKFYPARFAACPAKSYGCGQAHHRPVFVFPEFRAFGRTPFET
jgi:hypothetical protein